MPALLLASSSPYRRELLERLQLPFTWQSPSIDETRLPGEAAIDLVKRLAEEKARALAASHPEHLIIGSGPGRRTRRWTNTRQTPRSAESPATAARRQR